MAKANRWAIAAAMVLSALCAGFARAHEHHPPHKGTLVVLGEEFAHVELLLDAPTGELTAYVLDGEAEKPVRLSQGSLRIDGKAGDRPFTVILMGVGSPLTGETKWDTSEFRARSKALTGISRFEGSLHFIRARGTYFRKVWFLYPEGNEGVEHPKD